jgi:predicted nucleic acid-binding protein
VIAAPTLLYYEVASALRRYVHVGELQSSGVDEALDAALGLGVVLIGDDALHRRALRFADQLGLAAAYDAHYLALAERLDAELWTTDARLVRGLAGRLPWVRLIGAADRRLMV